MALRFSRPQGSVCLVYVAGANENPETNAMKLNVEKEVAALHAMTTGELLERYAEVFDPALECP